MDIPFNKSEVSTSDPLIEASGWSLDCAPILVSIFSAIFVPISRPLLEQEGNVSNFKRM